MIIEVAVGVFIGGMALRYEKEILKAAASIGVSLIILGILGVALAAGIAAIYWLMSNEVVLEKVVSILFLLSAFIIVRVAAAAVSRRSVLTTDEIAVLIAIAVFLVPATAFFVWFFIKFSMEAKQPLILLGVLPLVGLWVVLWQKLSKLRSSRKDPLKIENAEG